MTRFETELLAALPRLRATAMVFTRDRVAAQDLVQDCLVRALTAQHTYVHGTNLSGWLYRLMRNLFISALRQKKLSTVPIDDTDASSLGVSGGQESHLAQGELARVLATLPTAQREAILLIGASGLSYEEAALAIGCSIGTVKSRVSRAREALRAQLDGSDDEVGSDRNRQPSGLRKQTGVTQHRGQILPAHPRGP